MTKKPIPTKDKPPAKPPAENSNGNNTGEQFFWTIIADALAPFFQYLFDLIGIPEYSKWFLGILPIATIGYLFHNAKLKAEDKKIKNISKRQRNTFIILSIMSIVLFVFLTLFISNNLRDSTSTEINDPGIHTEETSPIKDTNTPEPANTITETPIPRETNTSSSTPTISEFTDEFGYPNISVGVLDLGEGCLQNEIISKISQLGFPFGLVSIDTSLSNLLRYDVLYLSDGWICISDQLSLDDDGYNKFLVKIDAFLAHGKGILIGNPRLVNESYDFHFPPMTIRFRKIEKIQEFDSENLCAISNDDCYSHWIINDLSMIDFPFPEVKINFPNGEKPWELTYGINSGIRSLYLSPGKINKFVIIGGGEFSSKEKTISDELFIRIMQWLAGDAPPSGDLEWYPYH